MFLKIVPVARLLITKNLQNLRIEVIPTIDKVNLTSHQKQLFGQIANDWNFIKMQHIGGYLRLASMHTHLLVISFSREFRVVLLSVDVDDMFPFPHLGNDGVKSFFDNVACKILFLKMSFLAADCFYPT